MTIRTLTTDTFDETVLAAERPVLVEFTGEWCAPCRQMKPVLARLAEDIGELMDVAVIDFDDNLEVGQRYEVMSLPTLILFISGEPVRRLVGARGTAHLREELSQHLAPAPRPQRLSIPTSGGAGRPPEAVVQTHHR